MLIIPHDIAYLGSKCESRARDDYCLSQIWNEHAACDRYSRTKWLIKSKEIVEMQRKIPKNSYAYLLDRLTDKPPTVSFWQYKIDYNKCLGSGKYGTVYELAPRPAAERGLLSSWFPYIYDYLYPVKNNEEEERLYCVKVYHSFYHYLQSYNTLEDVAYFWNKSFGESCIDVQTNILLHKHQLSNIVFYPTYSFYSQFKTLIRGKTLAECLRDNILLSNEGYEYRKSFHAFLNQLSSLSLSINEVHARNIMYDVKHNRWEIIDGEIKEDECKSNPANQLLDGIGIFNNTEAHHELFNKIAMLVKEHRPYFNLEDDYDFLAKLPVSGEKCHQVTSLHAIR